MSKIYTYIVRFQIQPYYLSTSIYMYICIYMLVLVLVLLLVAGVAACGLRLALCVLFLIFKSRKKTPGVHEDKEGRLLLLA